MKNLNSIVAAGVVAAVSVSASADLIAGWTIPSKFPQGAGLVPTGTSYLVPLAVNSDGTFNADPNVAGSTPWNPALAGRADMGAMALQAGFALGSVHQLASSGTTPTSYTSPAGNGSPYSFSSNVWKAGDYYYATFSTTGYSDVSFSWDMTRSSTGPATWAIEMSVDSGSFTALNPSFALSSTISFSASTYNPLATNTLNLGSAADNAATVTVRIRALVDPVNSSGTYQAGGTARIDNVMVNGTAVPAPGALALLGVAGLVGSRRRR
jgi:MYXO-CTERM domain-containing protein